MLRAKGARILAGGIIAAAIGALCVMSPPFTVVSLSETRDAEQREAFNPETYARALWDTELPRIQEAAPTVPELLAALAADPQRASERYGKVWGLGGGTFFMVKGVGRVHGVADDTLEIKLADGTTLEILTGRLFGNTVRNAVGVADPSNFSNSQDLNKLSMAMNRIVETETLVELRERATTGSEIGFCGAFQLQDTKAPGTLAVVPVFVSYLSGGEDARE